MNADGSVGIAFLWHKETGTRNFVSLATAAGLLTQFGNVAPEAVTGISADRTRFGGNCFPTGATVTLPRAFIVDLPNYIDR